MTLADVADQLHVTPGLSESAVWEMQGSQEGRGRRNSSGGFDTTITRKTRFRVLLRSGNKLADREASTLDEALQQAFEAIGKTVPEALTNISWI